ncbi:hypothetical protein [Kaistella sp.]|uniref:hypothetical protein n=1 Tax=Kaistella sp. TaxID=2782235 RepID=UPI002F935063
MMKFLAFLLLTLCTKFFAQETNFSKIPKSLNKKIQKNYERNNVFYFYFPEYKNYVVLWNYENGKVIWKSFNGNKLSKSGEFNSELNPEKLSINATNEILRQEIEKFNEDTYCNYVLDGAFLGYVYSIDNEEIIGQNSISTTNCMQNVNSKISKDFKKIFVQLYKTEK